MQKLVRKRIFILGLSVTRIMWKKYIYSIAIILLVNILKRTFADDDDERQHLAFNYENKAASAVTSGAVWPLGVVHYHLDPKSYDSIVAQRVRVAMNTLEDASCVRFKALLEPIHDAHWIHIHNPQSKRECVHAIANDTGLEMSLVLGYDCLHSWEILHALMHAIGFKDEVTHPQRDQYVRIMWENIQPQYHSLFRIRYDDFSPVNTEYDPMSIMHFHDRAFSKNGQATIAPLMPGLLIDPSEELSPLDKMRLRLIFGHECNKRKVGDLLDSCKTVMRGTDDVDSEAKVDDRTQEVTQDVTEQGQGNEGDEETEDANVDNNEEGEDNEEEGMGLTIHRRHRKRVNFHND